MLDANISYRDVENLPCIKKEICDLSRRIALCEAGDITNASIAGNFTSSSSSIMFDKSITCKDIQNIPLFKKKICELKAKLAACMAGNANASPSPTPSITPSPSPSNAPRATLTLRGGVGTDGPAASTAQELCGTQPFSTVWANVIEVNRFMSEGHDPSVITVVYESNTGPTVVNGNDKWAYSPLSGDDPAVRRAFQVSPNGVLYNFTTINCPSPSPTASVSPSPTPSTTPSPTPTPSTSTLTSILILLRTGVSPANPVCTDSTPMESGFYISNNENVAYLADGNTAHITTVYTNDTLTTRFDGGNLWYHFSNGSTTNVFQLDSNGTLSNHTTIDCTPTASPTPSITPSPTPSITPTPSIIHSTEARRVVEFWGTPSDTPNNRVGASTASGVCSGYNSFSGWIRQSEYDQYIINGDPSFITIIYDWLDGNVTINGSDTWFYPAASTTSSTTKRTFQLGTNGIPYNFTTIICPSPSPSPTVTASTTPSPTPTPTISDSPSPTPSITTTPTPSITPTPTGTPTPSVTPSPTPSITPSPSVTVGLFLNGVLLTSNPAVAYTNPIDLAAGDNTLTQLGGGSYVLRSLISGTGGLTNNIGAANLITMDNVNSYSGGTKLASGMMATNRAGAFGSGGIALSGGNLRFNNAAFTTGVINMTNTILQVAGSTGLIDMIGSGTASNNLALNTGTTTISNNSTLKIMRSAGNYGSTTFSSAISGAGTLIVGDTNSGVTPNTAANNQGRLIFSNANAFATFTGNINVLQRGNITMAGGQLNGNNVNIAGGGYMTLNAGVTNTIGDLSGAGTITKVTVAATGTLRVNSGIFTGSISTSPISGNTAIALTKIGLGSFFIGGSGNYASGTNINGGTFSIGHNNAMGTGIVTLSPGTTLNKNGLNPPNIIVNNGGTVNP